ncbi:V-set and immunoglobulin domain-containing protein 4 isoform X1 [Dendrobates tinctorius]|uniref:V-set and immunoglobulin domain-containing protein 4 isoform X1 n=1 Tax=Dendrobates tinctorius TaxID=92724 RepID=UPI003CC924E1
MEQFKWLFVFVICFSEGNASSDPSLNMKDTVTGVRGRSVNLPCTYTPSEDEVERIEWSLDSEVIIIRIKSQDDVPLTKFRERVAISRAPGDVSLTIKKLSLDDKGHIKCKVTWKKPDGTLISKANITILKILRVQPITEKPKENIVTTTHQERKTTMPNSIFTKKNNATIVPEVTTRISHLDDISHVGTVSTVETTKLTTIGKLNEDTTRTPLYSVGILYTNAAIAQKKGLGIPIYLLIILILCALSVITLVIALIIKKKKKKDYVYEAPTMNHLLALDGVDNGCQSCTSETKDSNTYELCRPTSLSVYEGILPPQSGQ